MISYECGKPAETTLDVKRRFRHADFMTLDDVLVDDRPLYRDKRTERFANGERVKEFQAFEKQAKRRLDILFSAFERSDLTRLPSNRFEAMIGDRKGQFSIRINSQWRICFEWPDGVARPFNIQFVDYH